MTASVGTFQLTGDNGGTDPADGVVRAFLVYPYALSDPELADLVAWAAVAHP